MKGSSSIYLKTQAHTHVDCMFHHEAHDLTNRRCCMPDLVRRSSPWFTERSLRRNLSRHVNSPCECQQPAAAQARLRENLQDGSRIDGTRLSRHRLRRHHFTQLPSGSFQSGRSSRSPASRDSSLVHTLQTSESNEGLPSASLSSLSNSRS